MGARSCAALLRIYISDARHQGLFLVQSGCTHFSEVLIEGVKDLCPVAVRSQFSDFVFDHDLEGFKARRGRTPILSVEDIALAR